MTIQLHDKAFEAAPIQTGHMGAVSIDDVCASYRWLGHARDQYTELVALHPEYRPGRENLDWNKAGNRFPRVAYARFETEVLRFVRQYHGERMVCFGLNPRPEAFANQHGYPRSAREDEIRVSQGALFDFDIKQDRVTRAHVAALERFLDFADDYFLDRGLSAPARGFSGRGYHLLFAYPAVSVAEYPDMADRLRLFAGEFAAAFEDELSLLSTKLDATTYDLRRVVRVYGTAKPRVGITSRFDGGERVEDRALRDYLLGLALPDLDRSASCDGAMLNISQSLPASFSALLERDEEARALWVGEGKPDTADVSRSGYDFSLACHLFSLGYRNVDELATVLALRPGGAFQQSGKGEFYLRRTIANALMKR